MDVEVAPEEWSVHNKLGACYANACENGKALEQYKLALAHNPFNIRLWVNIGISHLNSANYDSTVRWLLTASRLNLDVCHIWSHLSTAASLMNRTDLSDWVHQMQDGTITEVDPDEFSGEFPAYTHEELANLDISKI